MKWQHLQPVQVTNHIVSYKYTKLITQLSLLCLISLVYKGDNRMHLNHFGGIKAG